jgi:aspartyl/asparaginyl beta-hydroxylase (cupin superfamily)
MQEPVFNWNNSFVIPASLVFRPTPSGGLQVDGGAGEPTREVPRDWVSLLLTFARAQTAETAYQAALEEWDVDRESFQRLLQVWLMKGLLRIAETSPPAPSRLALFAQSMEADASRRLPLRSHFPLQRPLEFYPGLETREIHDPERFSWVAALEGSFPIIRDEFARLVDTGSGFSTVYRSQTSTGEWAASYFWVFGKKVEETCRLCPETARILSSIPGVAEFGTTFYSALAPHTHIAPHYGYSNAKLRCQLPLRVPGHCKLKVGAHEIEQREGRCIVFDDSFLHLAWNDSHEVRFVLVFDFFHPDLTPEEIRYLVRLASEREVAKALLDQAAAGDRAGWTGPETESGETAPAPIALAG